LLSIIRNLFTLHIFFHKNLQWLSLTLVELVVRYLVIVSVMFL